MRCDWCNQEFDYVDRWFSSYCSQRCQSEAERSKEEPSTHRAPEPDRASESDTPSYTPGPPSEEAKREERKSQFAATFGTACAVVATATGLLLTVPAARAEHGPLPITTYITAVPVNVIIFGLPAYIVGWFLGLVLVNVSTVLKWAFYAFLIFLALVVLGLLSSVRV
jgi:hypothetical protein